MKDRMHEQVSTDPVSEIVEQVISQQTGPNHTAATELELGAVTLGALAGGSAVAVHELREGDKGTLQGTANALRTYAQMNADKNDTITLAGHSYSHPEAKPTPMTVNGSLAAMHTLRYLTLTEEGVNEAQPGLSDGALAGADRLWDLASEDPSLNTALWHVTQEGSARIGVKEIEDLARTVVAQEAKVSGILHDVEGALHTLEANPAFEGKAADRVKQAAGVVGNAALSTVPFGHTAVSHGKQLIARLTDREITAKGHIVRTTDQAIGQLLKTDNFSKGAEAMERALWGMKMNAHDTALIPDDVDLTELVTAVTTRGVLRHADRVFDETNADPKMHEIAVRLGVAAAYDWCQEPNLSLTQADAAKTSAPAK